MALVLNSSSISGLAAVGGLSSPQTGSVLQVVTATYTTEVSTTSSSWTSTGLTATITPISTSSRILILVNTQLQHTQATIAPLTVFRGTTSGTNLGGSAYGFGYLYNTGVGMGGNITPTYLDSPSTTSAQQYTVAYKSTDNSTTVYANVSGSKSSITLLEIAG